MTIKDIYDASAVDVKVILRLVDDNVNYTDVVATKETLEEYAHLSIMCLYPQDNYLIIELC